jgi:spore coat protein A
MSTRRQFIKTVAVAGAGIALFKGSEGTAWAFSQSPLLRKFISPLPGLGSAGLPIAISNPKKYPGADYYDLVAQQYTQLMHPDLPGKTTLWGYRDTLGGKNVYLGPLIVAQRGRPSIIRMTNALPNKHPLPVDTTIMGAEPGVPVNRMCVHLHGGLVPWTMDGGPYAWFAANGTHGPSFMNPAPVTAGSAPGAAQYYYPNNQSARLAWYHDHTLGMTRLNAYAGMASGYLMTDDVVNSLTSGTAPLVPSLAYTLPLIIQDKSFKKVADAWGNPGDLWYPYQYESNPPEGSPEGRWDQGPPSDGFTPMGAPPSVSCIPEFFADTALVNGEAYPYAQVEPRRYRVVILNGSQARFYNLNLFYESKTNPGEPDLKKAGPAFIQIGSEGGLLPAPVVLNNPPVLMPYLPDDTVNPDGPYNLLMAPAERADLIIDFSGCQPGDKLILYNDAPAPFPGGDTRNDYFTGDPDQTANGGAPSTKLGKGPNTRTLMEIRVVPLKGTKDPYNFTSTYNALVTGLPAAYRASHIPFGEFDLDPDGEDVEFENKTLNEDFDGYGRLIQRVGTDHKIYADSYGRNYMDSPTEVYEDGQTVVWDVYNTTGDTHPMHFHLVNVQVIGRAPFTNVGIPDTAFVPPDPNYRGWKETVRMNPGEVTRVIMKFTLPTVPFAVPPSPRTGGNEYVWHCHILEHEEHDMMRPLIINSK